MTSGADSGVQATFSRNSASCGGAVSTSAARATFTGSTFDANKATTGGALCTLFSNVEVVVTVSGLHDAGRLAPWGAFRNERLQGMDSA